MRRRLPNGMHSSLNHLKGSSVINQSLNKWSMRELACLNETAKTDLMPNKICCVQRLSGLVMHTNHQVDAIVASPRAISLLRVESAKHTLIEDVEGSTEDGNLIDWIFFFFVSELRGRFDKWQASINPFGLVLWIHIVDAMANTGETQI